MPRRASPEIESSLNQLAAMLWPDGSLSWPAASDRYTGGEEEMGGEEGIQSCDREPAPPIGYLQSKEGSLH